VARTEYYGRCVCCVSRRHNVRESQSTYSLIHMLEDRPTRQDLPSEISQLNSWLPNGRPTVSSWRSRASDEETHTLKDSPATLTPVTQARLILGRKLSSSARITHVHTMLHRARATDTAWQDPRPAKRPLTPRAHSCNQRPAYLGTRHRFGGMRGRPEVAALLS
jgi:hypothetical protein